MILCCIDQGVTQVTRAAIRGIGRGWVEKRALDMVAINCEEVFGGDVLIRASIHLDSLSDPYSLSLFWYP
jgi:hypothetical protein